MSEQRPTPEALIQRAQEEERKEQCGKLKIYLGAAPGVGKTYAMLQDALAKREQELDIVVGIVETHGRHEIISMLNQLESLPTQRVDYRNKELFEFDLDGALKRSPAIILIDEMAHTNAPGLRHAKRWQDIKEILDRGIDVYTTLNVQHIESLNDVVSQIIQTRIKETVPDSMLDSADTIELVDLPPEDLLKRLHEGKVYFPEQAELAAEHFFQKGNLIALRELALRATAERVGAQVFLYRQDKGIKHIWPIKDKILVCVGSNPESIKIIRAARRMAASLNAHWIAIHVDSPRLHLSEEQRNSAILHLRLAEQLGAESRILTGYDVVKEIMNFAQEQNVTRIVVWKRIRPRWKEILFKGLADEIVRHSGEIDTYLITGKIEHTKPLQSQPVKKPFKWKTYGISIGIVAFASLIDFMLYPYFSASNIIMVYLLGVILVALYGEIGPSILASFLSVLAYDFFFIPAQFRFSVSDIQYVFTLLVMLTLTLIISNLTISTRRQAMIARQAEQHTASLHTLSRQLATTRGVDNLLQIAVHYLADIFDCDVIALLPDGHGLVIRAHEGAEASLSTKEQGVAQWVYDLGQIAGVGTDTLPFSDSLYVPLLASKGTIGVLRLCPHQKQHLFTPEQLRLLEANTDQIALALEVDRVHENTKQSELQIETDRVRDHLHEVFSRDLHPPLLAAMSTANVLMELGSELDPDKINKLAKEIYKSLEELSRVIDKI
jgi:two-component system, OmpR family, sensor histidine kinase KdpD